jgi:hypothetical protein
MVSRGTYFIVNYYYIKILIVPRGTINIYFIPKLLGNDY